MDCNDSERLLTARPLAELTADERAALEAHCAQCAACAERWEPARQSQELHDTVTGLFGDTSVKDAVMGRITGKAPEPHGERPGPRRLAGFEILGLLGRGGMGEVFKARQISMDRLVALKILPARLARNDQFIDRLIREARAAARLRHPNIVQAHDVGEADGRYYFAMEYVDGEGLEAVLRREGPLSSERARRIMMQVASALAAAHEAGIIHRDIKPSNIMLDAKGEVRVTDFGLAERVAADHAAPGNGEALGTPAYVAPEIAAGEPADPRSDLYSLGAAFFHVLAGRPPFLADRCSQVVRKQVNEAPQPLAEAAPHVDRRLAAIVDRLLAKDPAQRHPSAQALFDELDALGQLDAIDGVQAQVRAMVHDAPTRPLGVAVPADGETQPSRPARRKRLAIVAAAAVVCVAVGLAFALRPRAQPPATRAPGSHVTIAEQQETAREHNAEAVFVRARHAATREQWTLVQKDIARLNDEYAATAFVEEYRAAIDDLGERAAAELQPSVAPTKAAAVPDAAKPEAAAAKVPREVRPAVEPPKLPDKPDQWASLFNGQTLDGWRVAERGDFAGHGPVYVEEGRIVLERGRNRAAIAWTGDFPTVDYEVALEARRDAGSELTEILFPVGPTRCAWTVAGWSGTFTGLAMVEGHGGLDNDARRRATCRTGQWYRARLRVTKEKIEAWLDDEKYIDLPRAGRRLSQPSWLPLSEPFALTTWRSTLSLRNIRLKLLESQPEEPPADATELATASVAVSAKGDWLDTGLFLAKGKEYEISATGRWGAHTSWTVGPAGKPRDANQSYPLIGPRVYDLIGHVGEQGPAFHVDERLELTAKHAGRLFLRMNDDGTADNWGSVHVRIHGPLLARKGAPLISRFTKAVAKLKVGPADGWAFSGLSLQRGDHVLISADGTWNGGPRGEPIDADGYNHIWRKQRAGALTGRIGQHGALFTVGKLHLLEAREPGKLYLAVNHVQAARGPGGALEDLLRVLGGRLLVPRGGGNIPAPQGPPAGDPPARVHGAVTVTIRAPEAFGQRAKKPKEPPDLHCRLLATLRGHRSWVISVDFSPDGTRIASASRDRTLRLWDAKTGECLKTLRGHTGTVEAVAFSPDGKRLLSTGEDRTLRLWDVTTGECVRVLRGHRDWVRSAALFPDGKRAASTGADKTVKIWDIASGECTFTLRADSPSWCVTVSPDGTKVASASEKGWIRIWDADLGNLERVIFARSHRCWRLAYSPDGKRLASAGDDPAMQVWDAATGKCLKSIEVAGAIRSLAFSPGGEYIAAGGAWSAVRFWDATRYEHLRSLEGHTSDVRGLAFSPDGKRLATASFDRTIKIWTLDPDDQPAPRGALEVRPVAPGDGGAATEATARATVHTCAMHPQIKMPRPGKCPICAMALIEDRPKRPTRVGPRP